jgi:CheY-like chemotaxis protein
MARRHVLIVEDDPATRVLLEAVTARAGLSVTSAGDGQEALDMLEQVDPDVLLLDVVLPKLSGVDVLHRLAETRRDLLPRTVLLTASTELAAELIPADQIWALVRKPVDVQSLIDIIYDCLLQDAEQ